MDGFPYAPQRVSSCVTLGDRPDVEIHDLIPCEGLRVLKLYFHRHFSFAKCLGGKWEVRKWMFGKSLGTKQTHGSLSGTDRLTRLSFDFTMSSILQNLLFDILRNSMVSDSSADQ